MKTDKAYEIRRIGPSNKSTFLHFISDDFDGDFMWHYHRHFELVAMLKGEVKWLIGGEIGSIVQGDIFLLGPLLPHVFFKQLLGVNKNEIMLARFVMFSITEDQMTKMTEIAELRSLFEKSSKGLCFDKAESSNVFKKIKKMKDESGLRGLISLLDILADLNDLPAKQIVPEGCILSPRRQTSDRVDLIYNYLHNHYKDAIRLAEVAKRVNLSISGVCALFKRSSRQSINSYVHELRISHACRLLIESDIPITEIAFTIGYKTISSFNRKFKQLQNRSPREYRKNLVM